MSKQYIFTGWTEAGEFCFGSGSYKFCVQAVKGLRNGRVELRELEQ